MTAITFWSFLGLRLRQSELSWCGWEDVTQYICDDHHSALPGSVFLLSVHRLASPTVSQLGAAEWGGPIFVTLGE